MLDVFELLQIQATLRPLCPDDKQVGSKNLSRQKVQQGRT